MGYRVSTRDLNRGTKIERKEHPSLSDRNVRRVARDHLEREGPGYYAVEKVTEKIIESKTKQMGAKPKRRPRREPPYNPMTDGLPRSARRPPF
ncbi:MAG: hypothetical protein M0Q91_17325 [Methanoregula sp.]|jgi:hypothetical protein|nr:hypothetical protein [Methanoregula sp.]